MLQREATNGIELTIAKFNTFYAFKQPDVFEPLFAVKIIIKKTQQLDLHFLKQF